MSGGLVAPARWLRRWVWGKATEDRLSLAALRGIQVLDLHCRDGVIWVVLAREGATTAALARPVLLEATGKVSPPETILRIVEAGGVYEQYGFPLSDQTGDYQLCLSAGFGCAGVTLSLPAAQEQRRAAA